MKSLLMYSPKPVFSAMLVFAFASCVLAKGPTFADPEKTGPEFNIQGEYTGVVATNDGEIKIGVQIIALGKDRYRTVGFHGGLPGDGWNGDKREIHEQEAPLKDGVVRFENEEGSATIKNGVMELDLGKDGKVDGKLKRVVRKSKTLGQKPPAGAVVLFDGSSADHWKNGRLSEDGLLMEGTTSKETFGSHRLHIEFRLPFMPEDRGQGRGNSGLYVQGRYEVQMLDSFGLDGKQNECGGVYSVGAPSVNMCYPPLSWQTYDVDFTAAKYKDGKLVANPSMTVRHNGVVIHKDLELPGNRNTTAAPVKAGPEPGPVFLQNHGCPVRYRNVWVEKID